MSAAIRSTESARPSTSRRYSNATGGSTGSSSPQRSRLWAGDHTGHRPDLARPTAWRPGAPGGGGREVGGGTGLDRGDEAPDLLLDAGQDALGGLFPGAVLVRRATRDGLRGFRLRAGDERPHGVRDGEAGLFGREAVCRAQEVPGLAADHRVDGGEAPAARPRVDGAELGGEDAVQLLVRRLACVPARLGQRGRERLLQRGRAPQRGRRPR